MSDLPTRADYVAGLRSLADFIESTELPLSTYSMSFSGNISAYTGHKRDDAASVAGVERAAAILGVKMDTSEVGDQTHYGADRAFGPINLRLSHVSDHVTDLPQGGGEAAGSEGVSGPAATPTETAAGVICPPADETPTAGTPESGSVSAADPAPVGSGDGAAVTPTTSRAGTIETPGVPAVATTRPGNTTSTTEGSEWDRVHTALIQASRNGTSWARATNVATILGKPWTTARVTARLQALDSGGRVESSTDRTVTGVRGTGWRPRAGTEGSA